MISTSEVFVWAWLPGATDPVFAGALRKLGGDGWSFAYGRDYVARADAVSLLFAPDDANVVEGERWYPPTQNLKLPGAIRDASPDNWGRRVIINREFGASAEGDTSLLTEADYLLRSGSNRLGNLDFQASAREYVPRVEHATLTMLYDAARQVDAGTPLPPQLAEALQNGTAIGGARPKALLTEGGREYIAKFSTADDTFDVVGAEATSVFLAEAAGIPVAPTHIARSLGRKALIMERFDREPRGSRRQVVSALTILGLPETYLPIGSYPELIDQLATRTREAAGLREQLFRRVAFNIAISNTDDHLRNHAAFWDGAHLDLTPAYDLSPVRRAGEDANQALAYSRGGERRSNLAGLIEAAPDYALDRWRAREIVDETVTTIGERWSEAAERAELTAVDRSAFWGRLFLNPGALHGL